MPNDPKGRTYAELIAEAQAREAIKGRTIAAQELADRTEGKARQPLDVNVTFLDDLASRMQKSRERKSA